VLLMRCNICDWSPSDSHSLFNTSLPKKKPKAGEEEGYDYAAFQRNRQIIIDKVTGDTICSDCHDAIYEES